MTYSLLWLPDVLKNIGLQVAEVPGWQNRGRGDVGEIFGVICHHTAGAKKLNMPSLDTLINGRSDLAGPLAQLGLGRDGTYYVIAAGKCNHAGAGNWQGKTNGNLNFIGIEAENTGIDDPWPKEQLAAYRYGVAAILMHLKHSAEWCAGHKEYALPKGRKPDPNFDMQAFRDDITDIMHNKKQLEPIPLTEPKENRPTLRRGATGEAVKKLQEAINVVVDGQFGAITEAAVRVFQRAQGIVPDGIVGPKTWAAIDALKKPPVVAPPKILSPDELQEKNATTVKPTFKQPADSH